MSLVERHDGYLRILAAGLGVEAAALRAVLLVEGAGEGLAGPDDDPHPLVRLEVHRLWSAVPAHRRPLVDARFHVDGPRPWDGHVWRPRPDSSWIPLHAAGANGQAREWSAFLLARSIDEEAAVVATSWGVGQVLGIEWRSQGYASATEFAGAQYSEEAQLQTFVRYLEGHALVDELRRRDWRAFARAYNGAGQVEWYAERIAAAYLASRPAPA